jgi:tRNA(Ile)-lysidine synthase
MSTRGTLSSQFREFGRRHGLFGESPVSAGSAGIVVAVSGGVDSMVLLDLLMREGDERVIVAHFNHRLRGTESDGDEVLVEERARHYGVEFRIGSGNTGEEAARRGIGIQEVARELRYSFLRHVLRDTGARVIATGHQADDNAETILLHLFRGTGIQGMGGIRPSTDEIIRPLLFARRVEIENYAHEEGIPYRTDSSNAKDTYTRNALRHRVIPILEELVSPAVIDAVNRAGIQFLAAAEFIAAETGRHFAECVTGSSDDEVHLDVARMRSLPEILRDSITVLATERLTGHRPEYAHVQAILDLASREPGSRATIGGGFEALRERDDVIIQRATAEKPFSIAVEPGRAYDLGKARFVSTFVPRPDEVRTSDRSIGFVDADAIARRPLILRSWRAGDSFVPFGMRARKKISDFFVDEKVPRHHKHRYPILETKDGDVIWLCGWRIDDRFKITPDTRRVLRLEFSSRSIG